MQFFLKCRLLQGFPIQKNEFQVAKVKAENLKSALNLINFMQILLSAIGFLSITYFKLTARCLTLTLNIPDSICLVCLKVEDIYQTWGYSSSLKFYRALCLKTSNIYRPYFLWTPWHWKKCFNVYPQVLNLLKEKLICSPLYMECL